MDSLVLNPVVMSGYYFDPNQAWNPAFWNYNEPIQTTSNAAQEFFPAVCAPSSENFLLQQQLPYTPPYTYNSQQYGHQPGATIQPPRWDQTTWTQYGQNPLPQHQPPPTYSNYSNPAYPTPRPSITAPSPNYLSPGPPSQPMLTRHNSATSNPRSTIDRTTSEISRSVSPNPSAIADYGYKNTDGSWSCAWPGCTSRSRFTRACDLRKHYKRHSKTLFCRHDGCPQSTEGGFSSKKDRARHEAKHNPMITCEWEGCGRLFSRVDNMVSPPDRHYTASNNRTAADFDPERSRPESPRATRGYGMTRDVACMHTNLFVMSKWPNCCPNYERQAMEFNAT